MSDELDAMRPSFSTNVRCFVGLWTDVDQRQRVFVDEINVDVADVKSALVSRAERSS